MWALQLLLLLLLEQNKFAPALLLDPRAQPLKVLVFGDSWGAWGPSYHMLDDMFKKHGVSATVKSTAIAGTRACQWAINENNLANANEYAFPGTGADFVWLTVGGNDLLEPNYYACSKGALHFNGALRCLSQATEAITFCVDKLLEAFYERFPDTKVFQCGYDLQCSASSCQPYDRWPFCQYNVTCANELGLRWQNMLLSPMRKKYGTKGYTGLNILGTTQGAVHIPGAAMNKPILSQSAPCRQYFACVHPKKGSLAAKSIGEVFWNNYFSHYVIPNKSPIVYEAPSTNEEGPGNEQGDLSVKDTRCNWNWVPSFDEHFTPAPCNTTL